MKCGNQILSKSDRICIQSDPSHSFKLYVTIISHWESSDALQPIFLFPHESPWSTLNTEQAWSSWNIKSGHVTFCLKLVKSRSLPIDLCDLAPDFTGFLFFSFILLQACLPLTNSLSPFEEYLQCHVLLLKPTTSECTYILHAWSVSLQLCSLFFQYV